MVGMSTTTTPRKIPKWDLGWRLRLSMEDADISVGQMARTLQVSRQTVSRWLHGDGPVKAKDLAIWAEACGVDYYWLTTGEDPPPDGGSLIDLINRTVENQDDDTVNCMAA